ncbi:MULTISPECIES: sigma-70 family RNA polymerase sigma factor [unclassified Lysinibacillus]|uniref:sigma-70 family RNA polymerase sigma factor n=1 Tax=unclassified Lysinibacillus TaxID=2636778 RepID=UPI00116F06B1|nr:sigma-70 family RNA polymerase sigma factor [Lysinibacillus sp. CD3-6]QPQ37316.1 sigma-70 family RNA polymerase sigma factor [Lysinibacillus sp. JNUCC-52]UED80887.1 sigma-70 family RNA polymerase sigma factor [Lysinibacillus sp. CD3-6]
MLENKRDDEERIKKFEGENQQLINNELVISFLKIPTNKEKYMDTIINPTTENMKELDMLFKHFYFKIRFISHISSTLKFNSINFDKKLRLIQSRFSLTLDAKINANEGQETFLDLIADEQAEGHFSEVNLKDNLDDYVISPILYDALNSLTKKQKEIISLAYAEGLSDTEIGRRLNKSQQAVSKTHKKALENMMMYIKNHGEKKGDF